MNYGNTLMARGDYEGALDYFHRALSLAPQYSVFLINFAVAENATKRSAAAEQHFKDALRLALPKKRRRTANRRYATNRIGVGAQQFAIRSQDGEGFRQIAISLPSANINFGWGIGDRGLAEGKNGRPATRTEFRESLRRQHRTDNAPQDRVAKSRSRRRSAGRRDLFASLQ